ncbi:MAG: hypothetical protein WCW27_04495 [Patescibacteria group bacterium]|jgi:hypothetical protein
MSTITVRNIPNEIMELIKMLAQKEKRSLNNELVLFIEKGVTNYMVSRDRVDDKTLLSKTAQISLWQELSGKWNDDRSTEQIVQDIYQTRTLGREVNL